MYTGRNVLIFGQNLECEEVKIFLKQYFENQNKIYNYLVSQDYEEMYQQIVDAFPALVIVLADGVNGMECVYQAKKYNSSMPVFWYSDDRNFSIYSHRLECEYFAKKPLTFEKLEKAFVHSKMLGTCI